MLSQLFQHLLDNFHVLFSFAFGVDEIVIKIYYYENIEFFCQDLANVVLESGRCVGQSKRHYLVLKMVIVGPENCLPFITFSDSHLMVGIN